jgi:hypothetical protein
MAILAMAFVGGSAVLGVVVGLVAIMVGARLGAGSTRLLLTLTLAGVLIGAFMVLRSRGRLDRSTVTEAAFWGAALAVLGVVVAILSLVIHRFSIGSAPEWVFLILGLVAAGGAIGVGLVGSRAINEVDRLGGEAARTATSRAIRSMVPFQVGYVAASFVAIALLFIR